MESRFLWPDGIKGAVSLTYDDGLPIHRRLVGPLLGQHGLHATFYATIQSDLGVYPDDWGKLAAEGHELGNHTVFHPCCQSTTNPRAWLDERYDLRRYTAEQVRAELQVANLVLHLLDNQSERSYGNTCCDTSFGDDEQPIEPLLKNLFVAARGSLTNRIARPAQGLNLYNIGCIDAAGMSLEDLKGISEEARESGGWAVLMVHGIGEGTHELYVEADTHEGFVGWLAQQKTIWTAPVRVIARYMREKRLEAA